MGWQWALWAALAMLCQDLLSTWLVQAEADGRAARAGLLDTLNWPMGMAVTFTTVEALAGHDLALKVGVLAAVSAANYAGTGVAVRLGRRMRAGRVLPALRGRQGGIVSRAYHCEACEIADPHWTIERWGDAVVTWACDTHLAEVCEALQRDREVTKLSVRDARKAREWAGIARTLDKIAGES